MIVQVAGVHDEARLVLSDAMRAGGRAVLAAVSLFVAGCGGSIATDDSAPATIRIGPLTPADPERIPAAAHDAIAALADSVSEAPPDPHSGHHGHNDGGPATTVPLDPADQATFERQWAIAVAAVPRLDTTEKATAGGYVRASVPGYGIGTHWVNWTLIDQPFDPAHPSMLLFDEDDARTELVGFSYWIHADSPDGFAGPNDVWHQHTNLCVVNGWVDREMAATRQDCAGDFLAGSDLWMLHAWVVPALPNRWGSFATLNPTLCPAAAAVPVIARCPAG
jgi:hypothetical protein